MIRAPVTLRIGSKCGTCDDDRTRKNQQFNVTQEIGGSFGEMREKAASMFFQIVVKPRYRAWAQELVKEPTASSQLASVIKHAEMPRVQIHA